MALTVSVNRVNKDSRELLSYGTEDFPIAFFDDDLTRITVPWHWHNEFEIVIITEGTVRIRIASSEFLLKKGDGYFANRGILHSSVLESDTGHQHCLVFSPDVLAGENDIVRGTYINPILSDHALPFIKLTPDIPWQREFLRLADDAWSRGAYEKEDYPIFVKFNLCRVFSLIVRHMEILSTETGYSDKFQIENLRIKKAMHYIASSYSTSITINDIAKSADISVSTCLRLFKSVLNTTPVQYLIRYRIQKIVEELSNQNRKTIGEIACSCGFSDPVYFNRCFKKIYGCTPSEYIRVHSYD